MRYFTLKSMIAISAIAVLFAGTQLALADSSGNADFLNGQECMQDVAGFDLNCSNNDVQLAAATNIVILDEGHTHTYDFCINKVQHVDRKRNNLVEFLAYFCTTGHCLKWKDSYGEDKKYIPSVEGFAILGFKHGGTGSFARKKVTGDLFY